MYQQNIPAIYHELQTKSMPQIYRVLAIATTIASVAYIFTGWFGYVTFSLNPEVESIMKKENILLADYKDSILIKICLLGALFIVIFAAPFVILPSKDALETLTMTKNKKFSTF